MKERNVQKYDRIGVFSLREVFDHIPYDQKGNRIESMPSNKEYLGYNLKMTSMRYRLFKSKGTKCCKCGIKGSYFALEVQQNNKETLTKPHFNLYAVDEHGNDVLMTKDHTIPASLGGPDTLSNLTVMCYKCNFEKSDSAPKKSDLPKEKNILIPVVEYIHLVKLAKGVLSIKRSKHKHHPHNCICESLTGEGYTCRSVYELAVECNKMINDSCSRTKSRIV